MAAIEKKQASYQKEKNKLDSTIADLEKKVDDLDTRIQRAATAASGTQNKGNTNSGSNYVPPVGTGGGAAIVAEAYMFHHNQPFHPRPGKEKH